MRFPIIDFVRLASRDALGLHPQAASAAEHLRSAQQWLALAHKKCGDDGVSYGYSLRGGWLPSYRETSGYIATTFFNMAKEYGDASYRQRALEVCHWLANVQNADGSFANPKYGEEGIVFDTGQDLFGLVKAFEETSDPVFKDAAIRAANWLVRVADGSGHWTRNEHFGVPHVYNTRSAWALLRMHQNVPTADYERVARANLDWAVSQQSASGFFDNCAFKPGRAPFTHTIAYTARGLLESGLILNDARYVEASKKCADRTLTYLRDDGFLPGQISILGESTDSYCCVTGNCQFAIVWTKFFTRTRDEKYRLAANKALEFVMKHHDAHTSNDNIRGAVKGSQPIWGRYAPFSYPNWATKFFVDAMMLKQQWL